MLLFAILCLVVLFLALSAYVSAVETALFSLSPFTLRSLRYRTDVRSHMLAGLMEKPREVLVTLLMLNVIANILIQNSMSSLFEAFPNWWLRVGVPLVVTLVFGEIVPKALALPSNFQIAYHTAPAVVWMTRAMGPVRIYLTKYTHYIARFLFSFLREEPEISPDELRHVLQTSEVGGVLLPKESRLIEGALRLQTSLVKEHMRPREEILWYDIGSPLVELQRLFVHRECSRVPVCEGELDRLLGVISARFYFAHETEFTSSAELRALFKKPYYVPESLRSWSLLWNLRARGESLAIVVNEYGSISGLVTQEDLIEAVVGDIVDLRDTEQLYTRAGKDAIIAQGKLELSEFRELFNVTLKSDENHLTLGGWLTEKMGDIPVAGAKYETDQFLFHVLSAEPNRVRRVYVHVKNGLRNSR